MSNFFLGRRMSVNSETVHKLTRDLGVQELSLAQSNVCLTIHLISVFSDVFTIQVFLFVMKPRVTNFAQRLVTLGSSCKWHSGIRFRVFNCRLGRCMKPKDLNSLTYSFTTSSPTRRPRRKTGALSSTALTLTSAQVLLPRASTSFVT